VPIRVRSAISLGPRDPTTDANVVEPAGGIEHSIDRLRFGCSNVELHRLIGNPERSRHRHQGVSFTSFDRRAYQAFLIFKNSLNIGVGMFPAIPR